MKKQELIQILNERDVKSSNLRTAVNRYSDLRKAIKNFDQVKGWLLDIERKERIKQRINDERKAAKKFNMSHREYLELRDKAERMLSNFHTGHSMGCYRVLFVGLKKGEPVFNKFFACNDTLSKYAISCQYSPTYGSIRIKLTKKELRNIQNIEGVWTIVNADGTAKWLEGNGKSKSYYDVVWQQGFVYGTTHSTISLEDAKQNQKR